MIHMYIYATYYVHMCVNVCVHGKYVCAAHSLCVCVHRSMTMAELLQQLIKKAKLEAQESLRQLIGALNGLAGIYRLQEKVGIAPSYVNECIIQM